MKRLGTGGFKFPDKGSLPVILSSMSQTEGTAPAMFVDSGGQQPPPIKLEYICGSLRTPPGNACRSWGMIFEGSICGVVREVEPRGVESRAGVKSPGV